MHSHTQSFLRASALALVLLALPAVAQKKKNAPADTYVPPPASQIPGYSEKPLPCRMEEEAIPPSVICENGELAGKSLRELSLMRNTIFARYGWGGFRKPWVREYFQGQPWYRPDPKFSYKRLSKADQQNVHIIAVREQSFTERELFRMRFAVYARAGKVFGDVYEWKLANGKTVRSCEEPKEPLDAEECSGSHCAGAHSWDCEFQEERWYKPDPGFSEDKLPPEARIELGLISRALGQYASDDSSRDKASASLDRVLSVAELRQLSLRDLRLLRNTIYARRGRPFKSKVLQSHFSAMSWYRKDPSYTDARLTANDKRNIDLIRAVEDEFGGPLKDEDWLIDPATDGA
jgi:hypothetical protein